jgi:hypothetical protein
MNLYSRLQLIFYLVVLLGPVERFIYRLSGVKLTIHG